MTPSVLATQSRAHRAVARAAHGAHLGARRRIVQRELAQAARRRAVREAEAAGREEDRQDAFDIDGRRCARGAGPRPRAAAAGARVARPAQAQEHLHRRAATARQPGDRPGAHLRSTRRSPPPDGSAAPIRTCRTFQSAPSSDARSGGRSSPRQTTCSSRPTTRRSSYACSRTWPARTSLIDAFRAGEDIHDRTGRQLFGADSGLDPHELRSRSKMVNYAVLYGKTSFTLASDISVTQEAAQDFIDAYFRGFPARPRVHRPYARRGQRRRAWCERCSAGGGWCPI